MNIERGIRRLVIVVSGLILAVGMFAVVAGGGDIGLATVIVGVLLGLLWGTFFTLRWVARGFRADPNPPARSPQTTRKAAPGGLGGGLLLGRMMGTFMAWLLFSLMGLGLVFLVVAGLWTILAAPQESSNAFVTQLLAYPPVIWLRQPVGDRGAIMIGLGLAALLALGLVSECWDAYVRWRQSQALRRLKEHSAACQACQQLADANPDDFAEEDKYCPVGEGLNRKYMRT